MRSKILSVKILIPTFFLFLILLYFFSFKSNPAIRVHDDQIDIQRFTNAIAQFIIENGYGYQVEIVESTLKEAQDHLVTGEIDIMLELWKENNLAWYHNELNNKTIDDLGVLYRGGRQYWIIPRWYAREKNIKTVFDMSRYWRDFANPEDPSKGIFFNCIFGWTCRDINTVKLKAYGLDRYYNTVSPISPEALQSIYESARKRKLPVFGYYWEPTSIMTNDDWYILKEPDYSEKVWLNIIESASNPTTVYFGTACAFNDDAVHKIANANFRKKAPDVADMFEKMQINIQFFNEMLSSKEKKSPDPVPFDRLALVFLKNHPDQWKGWVTPAAQIKIGQALTDLMGSDIGK